MLFQLILPQHLRVRGAELKPCRFRLRDPCDSIVFQRRQLAGGDLRAEKVEMHHAVRVFLHGVVELAVYLQRDAKLLAALADDALLRRFARLDLAAGELPEQAAVLLSRALADQELVPSPDDRCRHFHHSLPRHAFKSTFFVLVHTTSILVYNATRFPASLFVENSQKTAARVSADFGSAPKSAGVLPHRRLLVASTHARNSSASSSPAVHWSRFCAASSFQRVNASSPI